jgi:serine/threonine-protein kinase
MSYADQVCAALAHAHANGVVHLGLDPTALVLGADGSVRVTGFAVPRPLRGRTPAVSGADGPVREAYRAPEEAPDGPVDERADLYALGCVLTALLTGRPPFEGDTVHDLVEQHRRVPPRLRDVPPDTSELVDALVADMLAKRPQDRPASAVEVRIRLVGGQVPGSGPGLADAGEEGVPSGPRRSWSVLLPVYVLVAGLLLTGALVIVATHGHALLRLL